MNMRLATALVWYAFLGTATAAPTNSSMVDASVCEPNGKPAKLTFTLRDAQGRQVRLADFKGRLVVLNFWATWCVPCRAEIPVLVELQAKYAREGLQVIGVSIDDPIEKMKPFVAQYKVNYPVLTAFKNDAILDAYGPMVVVPATFVIQRDGTICTRHIGPVTKEAFEREIKALF